MGKISKARNAIQAILEEDDSYSEWLMNNLVHNLISNTPRNSRLAHDICHGFENNFVDVLEMADMDFPKIKKYYDKDNQAITYKHRNYSQKVNAEDWNNLKSFAEAQVIHDNPDESTFSENAKRLGKFLNLTDLEVECLVFIKAIADSDPSFHNFVTDLLKSSSERFPALIALALDRVDDYQEISKAISPTGRLAAFGILDYAEAQADEKSFPIIEFDLKELLCEKDFDERNCVEQIVGKPVVATLTIDENFSHMRKKANKIVKAVRNAQAKGIKGINVVFYGPPGSGKTELAKAICAELGLRTYTVGEDVDSNMSYGEDGGKIDSSKRLIRLRQSQTFLAESKNAALIMDEMEDFLVKGEDTSKTADTGSKILLNRTLEDNTVPTFWMANDINKFHQSVTQRLKLPVFVGYQPTLVAEKIWQFHIKKNKLKLGRGAALKLARQFDAPPRVIEQACEVSSLLSGTMQDIEEQVAAKSTLDFGGYSFRYNSDHRVPSNYDMAHLSTPDDLNITQHIFNDASADEQSLSFLIQGPNKVGKSTLAYYLAEQANRHISTEDMADMIIPTQQTSPVDHVSIAFAKAAKADAILVIENFDKLFSDAHDSDREKMIARFSQEMEAHKAPVVLIQGEGSRMSAEFRNFVDVQVNLEKMQGLQLSKVYRRISGFKPANDIGQVALGDIVNASQSLKVLVGRETPKDAIERRIAASATLKIGGNRSLGFKPKA